MAALTDREKQLSEAYRQAAAQVSLLTVQFRFVLGDVIAPLDLSPFVSENPSLRWGVRDVLHAGDKSLPVDPLTGLTAPFPTTSDFVEAWRRGKVCAPGEEQAQSERMRATAAKVGANIRAACADMGKRDFRTKRDLETAQQRLIDMWTMGLYAQYRADYFVQHGEFRPCAEIVELSPPTPIVSPDEQQSMRFARAVSSVTGPGADAGAIMAELTSLRAEVAGLRSKSRKDVA